MTQNSEQAVNNGNLKPFKKGQSAKPGGRPKEVAEVKALARARTTIAINTLVKIAESSESTDAARVSACVALLDRGERNHEPKRALYVRGALYIRGY